MSRPTLISGKVALAGAVGARAGRRTLRLSDAWRVYEGCPPKPHPEIYRALSARERRRGYLAALRQAPVVLELVRALVSVPVLVLVLVSPALLFVDYQQNLAFSLQFLFYLVD